jgi:hypothetical protein
MVTTTVAFSRDVTGCAQFGHDAMGGALSDADPVTDLAQTHTWIVRDADQHLRVVGQELPPGHAVLTHRATSHLYGSSA